MYELVLTLVTPAMDYISARLFVIVYSLHYTSQTERTW